MIFIKKMIKNLESRFAIALPEFIDLPGYDKIDNMGGSIATSKANAIENYLHKNVDQRKLTRDNATIIQFTIRDKLGGYEEYAMKIPEIYYDDERNVLTGEDRRIAEEIEIALFLNRRYGKNERCWLNETRIILDYFENIENKKICLKLKHF